MPHHNFPEDIHPLHHKYIGHSTKHFPWLLNLYHWLFYTDSQRFIYCNLKEGIDFYGLVLFYEYLVFCVNVKNNLLLAYHDRKKNMWSDCQNAQLYCKKTWNVLCQRLTQVNLCISHGKCWEKLESNNIWKIVKVLSFVLFWALWGNFMKKEK